MTERDLQQLLSRWQKRMGLERWEIDLDLERPARPNGGGNDDYCQASVFRSAYYESATINLHPSWRSWSAAEAENHLVHELVHLWLRDLEQVLSFSERQLGPAAYAVLEEATTQALESAVELIARRLLAIANEAG